MDLKQFAIKLSYFLVGIVNPFHHRMCIRICVVSANTMTIKFMKTCTVLFVLTMYLRGAYQVYV